MFNPTQSFDISHKKKKEIIYCDIYSRLVCNDPDGRACFPARCGLLQVGNAGQNAAPKVRSNFGRTLAGEL